MTASRVVDVAALCHWTANVGDVQRDQPSHVAYHYGSVCPYRVVAAVLAGESDPRGEITEWRLVLPFKDGKPPMSLNDRYANYHVRNGRVNTIKKIVRKAVTDAHVPHLDFVHIEMHYRPKTNQTRDIDNLVATLKPCIDALHQPMDHEGYRPIIRGDDPRYVSWSPPVLHPPVKPANPTTWLVLRSGQISAPREPALVGHQLTL